MIWEMRPTVAASYARRRAAARDRAGSEDRAWDSGLLASLLGDDDGCLTADIFPEARGGEDIVLLVPDSRHLAWALPSEVPG